jgi:hypothetical protein
MKFNIENYETATRSRFVAPTFGGSVAGVCPQAGFRRVDVHAPKLAMVSFPAAGVTGATLGDRPWSPLIT